MSLTLDEAVTKIKKLLALSKSENIHEAALAASKAAKIMHDYQIQEAALSSIDDAQEDEPVGSHRMESESAARPGKKAHWRMRIASGCALVCNCRTYWHGPDITLIGRERDVQAARYLFDLIERQVEPLADDCFLRDADWEADKRRWKHAFRLGCADAIYGRLRSRYREEMAQVEHHAKEHLRLESGGSYETALVVVNQRLAKVVDYQQRLGLRSGRGPTVSSASGYASGRSAGSSVNLGGSSRGAIGAGAKLIG